MSPSVESTNLALSTVGELPGAYSTACEGSAILAELMQEGGVLDEAELSDKNLHFLYAAAFPQYGILSNAKPVYTTDDLAGLKIRAGGAAIIKSFSEFGAVPIQIPGSELYDALKRGTVDAAFFPEVAAPSYDLQEVVTHITRGTDLGGATSIVAVSTRVWDQLTDEQKQIFTEAGQAAQQNFCEWLEAATDAVIDRMVEEDGIEVITFTEEQRAELQERLSGVWSDWVEEMQSAGKEGEAVLNAFEAARGQ